MSVRTWRGRNRRSIPAGGPAAGCSTKFVLILKVGSWIINWPQKLDYMRNESCGIMYSVWRSISCPRGNDIAPNLLADN